MLGPLEQLMRLHPASQFGRWERGRPDFELFEALECRRVPREPDYGTKRRDAAWMIGEMAAAAAMLVAFIGVLTVIARLSADAPADVGQEPTVAVSDMADLH